MIVHGAKPGLLYLHLPLIVQRSVRSMHIHNRSAIHINDVVLLVLSKHSTRSDWVEHEVRKAREKEKQTGKDALWGRIRHAIDWIAAWSCWRRLSR